MKNSCSLKLDRYLDKNNVYRDLRTKLNRSLTEFEFIETYKIRISRFDFQAKLMYLCRVSFFTTLDIYKAYFKGRHKREYKENKCKKWPNALFSLKEATASLHLMVLVTKCFLIFIVDEVKNFITNKLQVGVLVMYWESCIENEKLSLQNKSNCVLGQGFNCSLV